VQLRFSPVAVFEVVEDHGVVIHLTNDEVFSLNGTGAFILTEVNKHTPPSQIAVQMADVFEVDLQTAEHDVQEFLSQLVERGILEEVS
jgi:hypothetical protein